MFPACSLRVRHRRRRAARPAAPPPVAAPSAAPALAASAYVLQDVASGQAIVAENADERREPASLTKLMTAYLTFAALRDRTITPTQMVPVSTAAWRAEGSRMFIEPRKAVTVDELLHGDDRAVGQRRVDRARRARRRQRGRRSPRG